MKTHWTLPVLLLAAVTASTHLYGQGTVAVGNTSTTLFRTNLLFVGTSGPFSTALGPWYAEVLTAPSSVTSVDASLQQLLAAPWSDTGIQMTNSSFFNGRFVGGAGGTAVANFWPAAQTNSFIVVGWSHGLGANWAAVAQKLQGAILSGGSWLGGGFNTDFADWLGATTVGFRQAGGVVGSVTYPTALLFGAVPDAQGNPITGPTDMWIVTPEPSAAALAAVALALAARSKRRTQKTQN